MKTVTVKSDLVDKTRRMFDLEYREVLGMDLDEAVACAELRQRSGHTAVVYFLKHVPPGPCEMGNGEDRYDWTDYDWLEFEPIREDKIVYITSGDGLNKGEWF